MTIAADVPEWLNPATRYIAQWLEFQVRSSEQPGCVLAVSHGGEVFHETAFGVADVTTGAPLTPRHRFRVASHSKTFSSVGIMKLREARRLRLDDRVDAYVSDLGAELGAVTIAQLLSHSGGLLRDGLDCGQWLERRPFLDAAELRAQLAETLTLPPNERFKYSNLGFGLLGMVIAAISGVSYEDWITKEVLQPAGLTETAPDVPIPQGALLATGHGTRLPLNRRAVLGSDTSTRAMAAATGFVSTAADLARFFGQLSPSAKRSILSAECRREMSRHHWRTPHSQLDRYYGLGTISGETDGRAWFGHSGAFPGYISRTAVVPEWDVAVSIVTNAIDGLANPWVEGALHIMNAFARQGAPDPSVADWTGRWWTLWAAQDLVPMGKKVLVAQPAALMPLTDASEIAVTDSANGRIVLANGYASHGETVRRSIDRDGNVNRVWLGGTEMVGEADFVDELSHKTQPRSEGGFR